MSRNNYTKQNPRLRKKFPEFAHEKRFKLDESHYITLDGILYFSGQEVIDGKYRRKSLEKALRVIESNNTKSLENKTKSIKNRITKPNINNNSKLKLNKSGKKLKISIKQQNKTPTKKSNTKKQQISNRKSHSNATNSQLKNKSINPKKKKPRRKFNVFNALFYKRKVLGNIKKRKKKKQKKTVKANKIKSEILIITHPKVKKQKESVNLSLKLKQVKKINKQ